MRKLHSNRELSQIMLLLNVARMRTKLLFQLNVAGKGTKVNLNVVGKRTMLMSLLDVAGKRTKFVLILFLEHNGLYVFKIAGCHLYEHVSVGVLMHNVFFSSRRI